jgi:hypothetical protein
MGLLVIVDKAGVDGVLVADGPAGGGGLLLDCAGSVSVNGRHFAHSKANRPTLLGIYGLLVGVGSIASLGSQLVVWVVIWR